MMDILSFRKMSHHLIIAIDGPSGAGKSTLGRMLALSILDNARAEINQSKFYAHLDRTILKSTLPFAEHLRSAGRSVTLIGFDEARLAKLEQLLELRR